MNKTTNMKNKNTEEDMNIYTVDYLLNGSDVLYRKCFSLYFDVINFLQNEPNLNIKDTILKIKNINRELPCYKLLIDDGIQFGKQKKSFVLKPDFTVSNEWIDSVVEGLKNCTFNKNNMEHLYTFVPCFSKSEDIEVLVVGFGLDTIVDDEDSKSVYLSFSTDYLINGLIEVGDEEYSVIKREFFNENIKDLIESLAYERIDNYYKCDDKNLFDAPKLWVNTYCQENDWYDC